MSSRRGRYPRRVIFLLPAAVLAAALAGCDQRANGIVSVAPPACLDTGTTLITVTPSSATLTVGDSVRLSASAGCAGAGQVGFTSDNIAVATVGATTGLVRAVAPGQATISATNSLNGAIRGSATIQVNARP